MADFGDGNQYPCAWPFVPVMNWRPGLRSISASLEREGRLVTYSLGTDGVCEVALNVRATEERPGVFAGWLIGGMGYMLGWINRLRALLGRNAGARIICASYSQDLADKFSRDCRALIETPFYKRVFPRTRLNPKKNTEGEFETTRRGYRLATSVGGTLTGRGGDVLIVDDRSKANDANSQVALTGAADWFRNTALSRLDDPTQSL